MIWSPNKWKVTVNEDNQLLAVLLESDGVPFNANGASQVFLRLLKQDTTVLEILAVSGFQCGLGDQLFMYAFNITAAQTAMLPQGDNQTVEIKIMFGALQKFLTLQECMSVRPLIF